MPRFPLIWALLLLPVALSGCLSPPPPASKPHYVLGPAYQAGGVWYYPAASYSAVEAGLAGIQPDGRPRLTADGEAFDQAVLAAAHQTLQLPAVAQITNLQNGRSVTVRINDRGPDTPTRLVAVTRRTAELLGFADTGVAAVRLTVLDGPSRSVAASLRGERADDLKIATAPRGAVQEADLPPPPGAAQAAAVRSAPGAAVQASDSPTPVLQTVPDRLPETVTQGAPEPVSLYIRLGTFSRRFYAEQQQARVRAAQTIVTGVRMGRTEIWSVRIGPLASVAEADRVLKDVIRDGVPDARIVVGQEQ